MHIKTDRYGKSPSFDYKDAYMARRAGAKARSQQLNTPSRRDFTPPRQHVKQMLKAAVEGFVWPTVA